VPFDGRLAGDLDEVLPCQFLVAREQRVEHPAGGRREVAEQPVARQVDEDVLEVPRRELVVRAARAAEPHQDLRDVERGGVPELAAEDCVEEADEPADVLRLAGAVAFHVRPVLDDVPQRPVRVPGLDGKLECRRRFRALLDGLADRVVLEGDRLLNVLLEARRLRSRDDPVHRRRRVRVVLVDLDGRPPRQLLRAVFEGLPRERVDVAVDGLLRHREPAKVLEVLNLGVVRRERHRVWDAELRRDVDADRVVHRGRAREEPVEPAEDPAALVGVVRVRGLRGRAQEASADLQPAVPPGIVVVDLVLAEPSDLRAIPQHRVRVGAKRAVERLLEGRPDCARGENLTERLWRDKSRR